MPSLLPAQIWLPAHSPGSHDSLSSMTCCSCQACTHSGLCNYCSFSHTAASSVPLFSRLWMESIPAIQPTSRLVLRSRFPGLYLVIGIWQHLIKCTFCVCVIDCSSLSAVRAWGLQNRKYFFTPLHWALKPCLASSRWLGISEMKEWIAVPTQCSHSSHAASVKGLYQFTQGSKLFQYEKYFQQLQVLYMRSFSKEMEHTRVSLFLVQSISKTLGILYKANRRPGREKRSPRSHQPWTGKWLVLQELSWFTYLMHALDQVLGKLTHAG